MKPLVLSIAIVVCTIVNAQQWCAPGAQWYHDYSDLFGNIGYVETHYAGDTMIAGDTCQILEHTKHAHHLPTGVNYTDGPYRFYTSVAGTVVFIWTDTTMDTLVHYGAVPGDQWQVSPVDQDILVSDTGNAILGGIWLKYLTVDLVSDGEVFWTDTIYERIGHYRCI